MIDHAHLSVERAFQASGVFTAWRQTVNGFSIASRDSALLRPLRIVFSIVSNASAGDRTRMVALTIGWALLAVAAIRTLLPAYAVSGLPWWWSVTLATFAFVVAFKAEAFATSWSASIAGRIWHRLTA